MKKLLLWLWMLNKRLFKKPTFLVILALIPLLVFGYKAAVREESGVLSVALAQEGSDPLSDAVIEDLMRSSQLIRFRLCQSPAQAEMLVRTGKVDAAWIFPADLQSCLEDFVADPSDRNAFVRVIERESNVMMLMTREKLGGKLYALCSRTVYLNFIRRSSPELAQLSDEALLAYYDGTDMIDSLFTFEQTGNSRTEHPENENYLLTPVRGLLGVVIVLCGLAAAMYFVQDSDRGTFAWVPERRRPLTELGCQLVPVVNVCVASLVSLAVIGLSGSVWQELLVLVLYSLCVSAFCMFLRRLCCTVKALGVLLPLLVVVMLVICPVFFDLGFLREFQYLFPPTYYINAIYNHAFIPYMLLYILVLWLLYILAGKLLKRA